MAQQNKLSLRMAANLLFLALGWSAPASPAFALATEHQGNEPIGINGGFSKEMLAAVNLDSRVYWYEVNGNPYFFFRGNTDALNKSLELFAAVKAEGHEVVLLPGSGETKNFKGETIPSNWHFNIPAGLYFASGKFSKNAQFTIYINQEQPKMQVDEKVIKRLITNLDVDDFASREKAERELAQFGRAAAPILRQALEAKPSEEAGRRLKALLRKFEDFDLERIRIPKGLIVLQVSDLLKRAREELKSDNAQVRGIAAMSLGGLDYYGVDVMPELLEILKNDKNEYVRRSIALTLDRIGKRAAEALPILRKGLKDADVNVRNQFEQTIKRIEEAKEEPNREDQVKKLKAIQENISRYCKTLSDKAQK